MNGEDHDLLIEIKNGVKDLKHNLYGMVPSDKGDIGEIKESVGTLKCEVNDLKPKVIRHETIFRILAGTGGLGGATAGVLKALGIF